MTLYIIGLIIAVLIMAFALGYLVKEKDKESKKIDAVVLAVGAVIAIVMIVLIAVS